jgi:tetratricopeptide (TPR) repeat protein
MHNHKFFAFLLTALIGATLIGCNQSKESDPYASAPESAPASAPPPSTPPPAPQKQELALYMVPLNPSKYSMQAIQNFKKRAQEKPDDVEALVGLADANFMIQRFEVARDNYEKALKADKTHVNARISLSNCYLFMQQPDEAIKQLDELLAVHQDQPEALYNKGLILLNAKRDVNGTRETWNQLVKAHPENNLAKQVKEELAKL